MGIFCSFDQPPICYSEDYIASLVEGLCTLESSFSAPRLLLNNVANPEINTGTTFTAVPGLTALPFTIPATGTTNWNIAIWLSYIHRRDTCGLEMRITIDGVAQGATYASAPNLAAGASPSIYAIVNMPIIAVAAQGNHTLTVEYHRIDGFGACLTGTTVFVSTIRVVAIAFSQ